MIRAISLTLDIKEELSWYIMPNKLTTINLGLCIFNKNGIEDDR